MSTRRPIRLARLASLALVFATGSAACIHDHDGDGVRRRDDCNDHDPVVFPGAAERCDGKDNDCDGLVDENLEQEWYPDSDRDGIGYASGRVMDCRDLPGYVHTAGDCNDSDPDVRPGGAERCDGKDNDCDGFVDVDAPLGTLYFPDSDRDGHGDMYARRASCSAGVGWSALADDCNDEEAAVRPGAVETCNGRDDDCDGAVDDVEGGCP